MTRKERYDVRRATDLWKKLTSFENVHAAAYRVFRGKREQVQAGEFFRDLEGNLLKLRQELVDGSYEPGPYRSFWISDPKPRLISAAPFRDRVVHHSLVSVIEPVFERRFIAHSYACRTGRGTHRALRRFEGWARSTRYVLKMDVRKFFPSMDHEILKARLHRAIKDSAVLALCNLIIDSSNEQEHVLHHFPGDNLLTPLERRRGMPIGNLTSQFFANVYLDKLDHFAKERLRIGKYLRYVDDFCCFHDDKGYLQAVREEVAGCLSSMRLKLNEEKSRIRQLKEGVEFLGFVVLPDRTRLNQRGIRRQRTRMRHLRTQYAAGDITWAEVKASCQAWNAHAAHGDTWNLRAEVFRQGVFRNAW